MGVFDHSKKLILKTVATGFLKVEISLGGQKTFVVRQQARIITVKDFSGEHGST
jgi:hypothetical protein